VLAPYTIPPHPTAVCKAIKQHRIALHVGQAETSLVGLFAFDDGVVMLITQLFDQHPAAARKVVNLARGDVEQILRCHHDIFLAQIVKHECSIGSSDVGHGEATHHNCHRPNTLVSRFLRLAPILSRSLTMIS
jgi:hypothetical protein